MNRYTMLLLSSMITIALVLSSCDLQTEPRQSVSPGVALENVEGIQSTLTSLYADMQDESRYGRHLLLAPEIGTDNSKLNPQGTSGRYEGFYNNNLQSSLAPGIWGDSYAAINKANLIIKNVDEVEASADLRDRIRGEALFHRALAYHDLLRVYSFDPTNPRVEDWDRGVILRTEAVDDVAGADERARSSVFEVYEQIEADLEQAEQLLEGNDRGDVNFATNEAAHALQARVQLYQGNWAAAEAHATEAIERSGLEMVSPDDMADNPFDEDPHPESIFELAFATTESLGGDSPAALLTEDTWEDMVVTDDLLELYDENDARLALYTDNAAADGWAYNWVGSHTSGETITIKFPAAVGSSTDNHPIMRLPEMYLIRAEARAEQNDYSNAIADLHAVQEARGMEPVDVAQETGAIIDEVFDERRRELAFEGHRWFDLKRTYQDIRRPAETGLPSPSRDDDLILQSLPTTQVENIGPLEQNPGY